MLPTKRFIVVIDYEYIFEVTKEKERKGYAHPHIHVLLHLPESYFDKDNYGYEWAIEARETINSYLLNGNYQPLIDYEKLKKAIQLAIPTPDHYLPLIYTLGLQQKNESLVLFNDKLVAGSLSMTSLKIS